MKLEKDFFLRHPAQVAKELLGTRLFIKTELHTFSAIITETEAYAQDDEASHSFKGLNKRNRMMFTEGGICYVYLIYGMYHCLNFVTEEQDKGSAVLIRALKPENPDIDPKRFSGPGKICRELGINLSWNGEDLLQSSRIWLNKESNTEGLSIIETPRIGISKAIDKKWRYVLSL